ncbi:hypothetical protein [uncultured Methylobacterium sp.]
MPKSKLLRDADAPPLVFPHVGDLPLADAANARRAPGEGDA